jgi:hypothetical protein
MKINKALHYDGKHYTVIDVPYYAQYDSKKDNVSILKKRFKKCAKNVRKNAQKTFQKMCKIKRGVKNEKHYNI